MAAPPTIAQPMEPAYKDEATSTGFTISGETYNAVRFLADSIYAEEKKKLQGELDAKDRKIAELEEEIRKLRNIKVVPLHNEAPPEREYKYDRILFPKNNADDIIDSVRELTKSKRERDKYIIANKTDWYIVSKSLHYFGLFTGDEYDFLDNILSNVLADNDIKKRAKKLSARVGNFCTIPDDSPMKAIPVALWGKEAKKEREKSAESKMKGERTSNAITTLNRCYNIKQKLLDILIHHGVKLDNY